MKLEDVIKKYGTSADYLDIYTGRVYKLPQMSKPDKNGNRRCPVYENGIYIGNCIVSSK